ncbi:argininosuccinate lyase, partial [Enterocloster aldenensis]|uniref:argininosuccinate lyase n=1 Tax=Enterocloster aldenensis TaxID=358742 RepID=UPI0025A36284|nr:argininosuccinate lyase [Enterocloster aldenensis]
RVTEKWAKSGNNWYYLDTDGEMAIDTLIEDGDNYYYVDINGVMAANQWVAIDNEDAGEDNEPDHYWYYFQANGKALKNGDNSKVALKTVNGKKYAFDEDGKMLYGWVKEDDASRIDNTDGDGFKEGDYYFGGEDDGAMTVGWLQMDITYDEATSDKEIAPVFNDDEDQTRWFYFQSNGKKVRAKDGDVQKSKTINGKKYEFDQYGTMTAEWSLDVDAAKSTDSDGEVTIGSNSTSTKNGVPAKYARQWRYFNSVEDGSRVSKGWFKVVAAEYLNYDKNNDDEDAWYYADGSGNLYAGEFKTIKGKKYAFRNDGRMVDGLKFINEEEDFDVIADDHETYPFDDEDKFNENAPKLEKLGYKCYYFGNGDDGAMRTNKTNINIDGDNYNFYFEKSGGNKGAGLTGEKDDKYYQSGKLLKAGSDEKYQVVEAEATTASEQKAGASKFTYSKVDDAKDFLEKNDVKSITVTKDDFDLNDKKDVAELEADLKAVGINKKIDDISELFIFKNVKTEAGKTKTTYGVNKDKYFLVNTSGKVVDSKSKNKDGNDYQYVVAKGGQILAIYVED